MINLNDIFYTFQGEGYNAGRRALFIRVPYCNYSCPWCDTEYNSYDEWSLSDFRDVALSESSRFAVLTGGEPMMHKHSPMIISELKELDFEIACETNGSRPILDGIDYATVSPKKYVQKLLPEFFIHPHAENNAGEFKYVVEEGFDFSILDRHDVTDGRKYYLSPEYNIFDESLNRIHEYIKENPGWRISLQTHKIMNIK